MSEAKIIIKAKDATAKAFNSVNEKLGKLTSTLTSTQAKIAGLVGAGGFGAFIKISGDAAYQATVYANALGMSTQEMQAWQHAAKTTNVEGDKMADIFKDMSEKIGDAFANKGGEAYEVLERLNISTAEMVALSPDQQLIKIAEGLNKVGTYSEKVQIMESLGSDASLLLPLLENNAEKFQQLRAEAIATGAAISDIDAAKLEAANASLKRSQSIVSGVGQTIAVQMSPYIEAAADLFAEMATQQGGFKEEVLSGTKSVVKAVAFMSDMWRGLEAVWQGLKVIFWGFISATLTGLDELQNGVVGLINILPGVEVEPNAGLAEWAESARNKTVEATNALQDLVMQPMPSAAIEDFFAKIEEKAQAAAEKTAQAKTKAQSGSLVIGEEPEMFDAKLQERLEKINSSMLSENDRLRMHHEEQRFIVEEAFQAGLLKWGEHNELLQNLETQHQAALLEIEKRGWSDRQKFDAMNAKMKTKTVLGEMTALTAGVAQHNKAMFEVNKVAATAEAIINAHGAASKAYETYASYPPLAASMAALAYAAGYARVQAIQSTSFSGGGSGSTPSSTATAPVVNSTPVPELTSAKSEEPQQQYVVQIYGDNYGIDSLEEQIVTALNNAKDRDMY